MLNLQGWLGLTAIHHFGKLEFETIFFMNTLNYISMFPVVGEKEEESAHQPGMKYRTKGTSQIHLKLALYGMKSAGT